jgi:glycosyltransferase involved in cell wall biosynthesis
VPDESSFTTSTFIRCRGSFDALALWPIWQLGVRLQPDIVDCWKPSGGLASALLARQSGRRLIHTVDGNSQVPRALPFISQRLPAKTCQVVTTAGEAIHEQAGEANGVTRVPLGVEIERSSAIDRESLCRQLNVPSDAHLLVTAGETLPFERTRDVIWACDLLKCIRNDYRLIVMAHGPFRRRLERFVEQCQLNDLVRFASPALDLPTVAWHAEVFLTASLQPATELLLTAMAAGSAVVATDLPAHQTLITPGNNGFLAPARDRAAFARLIRKLLENPELRASIGEAGRKTAQHFEPRLMAARYASVYQEMASRSTEGR